MTSSTVVSREELLKEISESTILKTKKDRAVEKAVSILESIKKEENLAFEIFLGGSYAKGTDIKGSDVDIFLLFSDIFDPGDILRSLRKAFPNGLEEYSEHPYLKVPYDSFSIDLVPGYRVASADNLRTAVDRTPLHVEFVKGNFTADMKAEVKILKQFLKGIGVYGAESSIQGFSGYVTELLIYRYKTFENALESARNWNVPHNLDPGSNGFNNANLTILDPVDKSRNAAANVSIESLSTFILASKFFSWPKWKEFFFPSTADHELPGNTVAIYLPCKKCNEETLLPNLRRVAAVIKRELETIGFRIIYSSAFVDRGGFILLIPESNKLGEVDIHLGPPVTSANVYSFLEKWKEGTKYGMPFVSGDRICVARERKVREVGQAISDIIPRVKLAADLDRNKILVIEGNDLASLPSSVRSKAITPSLGPWVRNWSGDVQGKYPES